MARYRPMNEFEHWSHWWRRVVLWQQHLNFYLLAAVCGVVIVDNKIGSHFTCSMCSWDLV